MRECGATSERLGGSARMKDADVEGFRFFKIIPQGNTRAFRSQRRPHPQAGINRAFFPSLERSLVRR